MANLYVIGGEGAGVTYPHVRTIGLADLKDALARGLDDFCSMPSHVLFISIIYPLVALARLNVESMLRAEMLKILLQQYLPKCGRQVDNHYRCSLG
jgi:uncharacterized membrane protein